MSRFIETIHVRDGIPRLLEYHQQRMDTTIFDIWGTKNPHNLNSLISVPIEAKVGVWKCRIVYDSTTLHITYTPYEYKIINSLQCVADDDVLYSYKAENRDVFASLLQKKSIADEILIISRNMVTDTSYSNIMLFDGSTWITPTSYLLPGTKRAFLLETRQIIEKSIMYADIFTFEKARLLNCFCDLEYGNDILIKNIFRYM